MKKILTFATFLVITFLSVGKVHSIEADVFIQSVVNRAAKTLGGNLTKDERIEKLKDIARETVDIDGIGRYTLGSYKNDITDNQITEYKVLFRQYFLKTFASRLAEYSNPEIEVISKKKLNESYTMVSSILVATEQRPEVKIDWRVSTKDPDNLLIMNLVIEGLSLARTQKEEFSSIIEGNDRDINALFATLKQFIKQ
ncbi:ABC transporter substrate-binding protein [Candidatus Pelagibacter sp. Uisw_092]|jgi:phospholipid transport system substrate-binding protein|uniref:MlaC/ttg2D family ABC transporter substrate-binding protein n=1 Tax=Candidatus Pelagibacter sp. Uisw_092 TaxID=3230979 RepID=UPI0039EA2D0D